jgi:hypothetical protein
MELTKNSNFHFFAANRKWKRQTSVCFFANRKWEEKKMKFVFLGRQKINGNQRLLF